MHDQPTCCCRAAVADEVQRVVMLTLLSSSYLPLSRAELEREIVGPGGAAIDTSQAIEDLHAAGLVNLAGETIIPSRAAVTLNEMLGSPL